MKLTAKQTALLNRTVARGKRQILHDVRVGHVPRTVPDFATLHDYRDANMYGLVDGEFDPAVERDFSVDLGDGDYDNTELFEFYGMVQDRLAAWVETGVLRKVVLKPGALAQLKRDAEDRDRRNGRAPQRNPSKKRPAKARKAPSRKALR